MSKIKAPFYVYIAQRYKSKLLIVVLVVLGLVSIEINFRLEGFFMQSNWGGLGHFITTGALLVFVYVAYKVISQHLKEEISYVLWKLELHFDICSKVEKDELNRVLKVSTLTEYLTLGYYLSVDRDHLDEETLKLYKKHFENVSKLRLKYIR